MSFWESVAFLSLESRSSSRRFASISRGGSSGHTIYNHAASFIDSASMGEPVGNIGGSNDDSSGDIGMVNAGGDGDGDCDDEGDGRGGDGGGGGGIACGLGDCGYQSGRRGNLSRHRITMHRCLASPLLCCQAAFDTKHEYERHRREAHATGYRCPDCGRVFSRRALLTRHSYIHAERKPFQCGACQRYSTASKSNLRRHLQVCGRQRIGSPMSTASASAATAAAAGSQETHDRRIWLNSQPRMIGDHLTPLFRASIHISCGPATAPPAWLPWPAAAEGDDLSRGLADFHHRSLARHPPAVSAVGGAGTQTGGLLPQFPPGLFYNPLAMPSQPAACVGSNGNQRDVLGRAGLVKEEAMHGKETSNNGVPMFPPGTALDLSEPHYTKRIGLLTKEAGNETVPNFGKELGEKRSNPNNVPHTAAQAQLSNSNGAGKRKIYRSFHMSDILSPDS